MMKEISTRKIFLHQNTHIYFHLLRPEVPLETRMHVCIEGDFNDAVLDGHHVFNLVCPMTCCD